MIFRNRLKVRTLELFARSGPIRPGDYLLRSSHFGPNHYGRPTPFFGRFALQAADTYLRRLTRMGLLKRRKDARGHYLYMLSEPGAKRLAWLQGRKEAV